MTIRLRMMLVQGITSAFLLIWFGVGIYSFSEWRRALEFQDRTIKRIEVLKTVRSNPNNLPFDQAERLRKQFYIALPFEKDHTIPIQTKSMWDSLAHHYPSQFLNTVKTGAYGFYRVGHREGGGRLYQTRNQQVLVILEAEDVDGFEKMADLRKGLFWGTILFVIVIMGVSWWMAAKSLEPLRDLVSTLTSIRANNLSQRIPIVHKRDELGQLARTFNEMLERLDEAFTNQKHFIANASHELRNPLTTIMGESEWALQKPRDIEVYQNSLQTIYQEAERLDQLQNHLLLIAKAGQDADVLTADLISLEDLLLELQEDYLRRHPSAQIRLDFEPDPDEPSALSLSGNAALLRAAISNLLDNACKFSENKPVHIRLWRDHAEIKLQIRDQGIGILPADLAHIREPLFRSETARAFQGFGLGLALADRIIRLHNGTFKIDSEVNKGTTVTLFFPTSVL